MSETIPPLVFRWEGDALSPMHPKQCDKHLVIGQQYVLVEYKHRTAATHNHYFAAIANAWQSLPDHMLTEYPHPEALRKKLLIRCGYADERSIVCASKAEALRVAAFIKPMDEYAIVTVREAVVRVYVAQSQSLRAMGKADFHTSKQRVLDALDDLLGVERGATATQGQAA